MNEQEGSASLAVTVVDGVTVLDSRPVLPEVMVASAHLDDDLARTFTVSGSREVAQSPLELLLGLHAPDLDPSRVLELTLYAGLDWAGTELTVGDVFTGSAQLELATHLLEARRDDLALLERVTMALAGDEAFAAASSPLIESAVLELLEQLSKLIDGNLRTRAEYRLDAYRLAPEHRSSDLFAVAAAELLERAADGVVFTLCRACGRPFAALARSDEVYCRRTFPGRSFGAGSRSCRGIGPQMQFAKHHDPLVGVYRRHYKRIDARARRGAFGRTMVDAWRFGARERLKKAQAAGWSVSRFEKELAAIEPLVVEDK